MRKLYVEYRLLQSNTVLSWDLARHLYARQFPHPILIVVENPGTFLPAIRKQWLKVARSLQSERARTLDASLIFAFMRGAAHMQQLQFTLETPQQKPDADVFLLLPSQLANIPKNCRTLYVTCPIPDASQLLAAAQRLPKNSLVVCYDKATAESFRKGS